MRGEISVIITTYNYSRYLAEAVESVLKQSYPAHEVVVVDDGSTDSPGTILSAFGERVKYLRQENSGIAAARNLGLRQINGDVVAFLDADDIWTEDKLSLQIEALKLNPNSSIFGLVTELLSPDLTDSRSVKFNP